MTDDAFLEPLIDIAEQAGRAILEIYATDFAVEFKDDESPLTVADKTAHNIICEQLRELTDDIPILSEESNPDDTRTRAQWTHYWLVDPLDGTKEFVQRNGEFTVNIALIERGRPIIGVVHAPTLDTTWMGVEGGGAFRKTNGQTEAIHVQAPHASPVRVVCSRSHLNAQTQSFISQLGAHKTLPTGSSLKFCRIAEGSADIYPRFGPTSHWDTGAAHAVVNAAGGAVTQIDGTPLRYTPGENVLNPPFLVYGDTDHDWHRHL